MGNLIGRLCVLMVYCVLNNNTYMHPTQHFWSNTWKIRPQVHGVLWFGSLFVTLNKHFWTELNMIYLNFLNYTFSLKGFRKNIERIRVIKVGRHYQTELLSFYFRNKKTERTKRLQQSWKLMIVFNSLG